MTTFTFKRVQSGFWGQTELARTIKVRAMDEFDAQMTVNLRKDSYKRLANGDTLSWTLVGPQLY